MNGINSSVPISYSSADVGVLTPPDKLVRFKVTDKELEDKFQRTNNQVTSKEKHYSFEDKKKTPLLVKLLFGGGIIAAFGFILKSVLKK